MTIVCSVRRDAIEISGMNEFSEQVHLFYFVASTNI